LAAFAIPELLPNKWRHIAVVIADAVVLFAVVVGPVAGRFAIQYSLEGVSLLPFPWPSFCSPLY
jgi:hypothetical protein